MGRKKRGILSHDQLVKDLQADKSETIPNLKVRTDVETQSMPKDGKEKKKEAKETIKAVNDVDNLSAEDEGDVFGDIVETDDEISELTRLMSCVDIAADDDPLQIDNQINFAGVLHNI